ncbi:hypothetical protein R1flu_002413 [Riccia fluitans]|uniref:Uncharacterized protein n=1 Tax=Riccia fluitans TaxID=41844 RepID=A0ABD1Y607_9MARC
MALNSGSRVLSSFAFRIRSVSRCCKNSILLGESAVGSTSRSSVPCSSRSSSAAASAEYSGKSVVGNQSFSAYLSRCPSELASTQSLLPLYSATAAARLVSRLSSNAGEVPVILHDDLDGT